VNLPPLPLALYLHFPWCVKKCPYCDFNSHAVRGDIPEDDYVSALIRDLDLELSEDSESSSVASRPLVSIFMGGGTPSLFSDRAIGQVLEAVNQRLAFAPDIEITLEANPGTAEAGHFPGYRAAGVNRLSMGFQSLDDAQLQRLGRIHNSAEARRAYDLARNAGFDNINLDMMFALPEQSVDAAIADLSGLIALGPEHLSWYQLTLEANTEFGARPPPVPDDDSAWEMQEQGQARLAAAGYAQYEVSAYASNGLQARHNRNYWEFGDYLGIGAGAHGKRSRNRGSELVVERRARHKHPRTYQQHAGRRAVIQEETIIGSADLPFEFMMNALRLNDGFTAQLYEGRTGLPWDPASAPIAEAMRLGLLVVGERIQPSEMGRRYLNRLLQLFL